MGKKKLSKEDILHLAKLSALNLPENEVTKIEAQLEETLEYIENLRELDTEKMKSTNSVIEVKNIGFEDGTTCERMFTKEEAMKNSKNKKGKFFAVKRIL